MDKSNVFRESVCPDAVVIKRYAEGKCNREEVAMVEEHLTSCALCSDALEGILLLPAVNSFEEAKRTNPYKKPGGYTWMITASVVIITLSVWMLMNTKKDEVITPVTTSIPSEAMNVDTTSSVIHTELEKVQEDTITGERAQVEMMQQRNNLQIPEVVPADIPVIKEVPVFPKKEKEGVTVKSALPVKYIYDLKVIDYSELYAKYDLLRHSASGSLSPGMENRSTIRTDQEYDTLTSEIVLQRALNNFKKQQYRSVILMMNLLLKRFPDDMNAQFYSALSYYYLDESAEAEKLLIKLLAHKNTTFDEEANWYLANVKLNLNKREAAVEILTKIEKGKGFYSEMAANKLKLLQ